MRAGGGALRTDPAWFIYLLARRGSAVPQEKREGGRGERGKGKGGGPCMWFFFWNILYVVPAARFKRIKKKTGFSFAYLADLGGGGWGWGSSVRALSEGCVWVCVWDFGGVFYVFFWCFFLFLGEGEGGRGIKRAVCCR